MPDFAYPLLTYFLKAFLHQDWRLEYESDLDALDDFLDGDNDVELLKEIGEALTISEADLDAILLQVCGYYYTTPARDWLERLRTHILNRRAR